MTSAVAPLQFLPSGIQVFDELPGTNDYLKEVASASENLQEGTVIWALNQTHGKGQHLRDWQSEPGKNITLSLLLKPAKLQAFEAFMLSKAMALAVYQTVSHFADEQVNIKWPNDILLNSRKVAGILIENSILGDFIKHSVVGIGLNVNQSSFSSDNSPNSLHLSTGETYVLKDIVDVLLSHVSECYLALQLRNYKWINTGYFQNLYKVHEPQSFFINNEVKTCSIKEVLEHGAIALEIDGEKKEYLHGEARWKI